MTEASTTRRPSSPMHPQPLVDHRHRIAGAAHLGGADRMEDGGADVARGLDQRRVVVADRPAPGRYSTGSNVGERRLRHDPARDPDRIGGDAAILVGRKIVRLRSPACRRDRRERSRTMPRLVGRRLHTLAVKAGNSCSGSPNLSSDSGWTWNWMLARSRDGIGAREQPELRRRHGERAAPEQRVVEPHARAAEQRVIGLVQRLHAGDLVDAAAAADGPAGSRRRPAGRARAECRALAARSPGPTPDSRRSWTEPIAPGGEDHLAAAARRSRRAILPPAHARGALALEHDALDQACRFRAAGSAARAPASGSRAPPTSAARASG